MKSNRRRNYLRMLILASLLINLEITFLGTVQVMTVETASIAELAYAYEPRVSRLIYYLVYANYQARELVISRDARELAGFDEEWPTGPRLIPNVRVVPQAEITPVASPIGDNAAVREYPLESQVTLVFVPPDRDAIVETVYAIRQGNTILFFPGVGGSY